MKHRLLIVAVAAFTLLGATAASAQTIARSQLAQDNYVRSSIGPYAVYLPGQGGCVEDSGFGWFNACDD